MAGPPVTRSAWIALAIGTVFAAIGVGLVAAGFGDQTDTERRLLDLSGPAFSAAFATGIVQMTIQTKVLHRGDRAIGLLFAVSGLLVLAGAVLFTVGFTVGPRNLTSTGTLLMWAGLGLSFCFLVWRALKGQRPVSRAGVLDEWLVEEPEEGPDGEGRQAR